MSTGLFLVRHFRQIPAILFQGLKLFLRGLVRDPLGTAQIRQGLEDGLRGDAVGLEQLAHVAPFVRGQGPKQVLGGNIFVFHLAGLFEGFVQGLIQTGREVNLGLAAHPGQPGQQVIHPRNHRWGIDLQFLQEGADEALLLGQEGAQQVGRLQLVVAQFPGQFLGPLQGLLGFVG
jgi:hypothetical protein